MTDTPDSGSTTWDYRTVLSADSCLFHKGAVAHPGLLELGEDVLTFSPTRMLDRFAGAQDLEIPVLAITELAAGGIHHNLDITVGEQTLRFSGKGALRVHARLVALLAEGEALPEGEQPLFEPGERVILQGPADLYVNDLVAVRGEITLSNVRFRFMPGVGLERLLWSSAQIDVRLADVADWTISGLRRLFECQINGKRVRVGGALAPTLFQHFSSNHQDSDSPDSVGTSAVIEQWKVQLRRGPIAHTGDLDISPDRLQFRPTGLLDAAIGVSAIDLELDQITTLTRRGWAETKIEIRSGHKVHTFSIPDHRERFDGLMELIRDRHYRRISALSPGDPSAYSGCLDAWSERIRYDDSEQVVVSSVGVLSKGPNEHRIGWLILTRSRLLFLPIGGPASKQDFLELPLGQICRLDGGPRTPDDQISLSADEVAYRFFLAHREGLVEEFWAQCRSPTRVLDWSTIGPRSLSRINGEARFIRILSHGEVVIDLSPALTVAHSDGVALLLPGEPGSSLPLEQWVTVEIGQSEGIYQFDSRVVRSAPIPLELPVPNPDQMHLLITAFPSELRVYNQRDSYRVPTHMHLRAHVLAQVSDGGSWMSTGEAFECDMLDLSIGGALVRSMQPMEENQRVSLNLPLMDQWVEIRATCVRSEVQDPEHPGIMYGMEFRELSTTQEDMLHKAIMQLQREALVDEEEGEGLEDD